MGERRGDPRLVRNNHSLWHRQTHTHTQHFTDGTGEREKKHLHFTTHNLHFKKLAERQVELDELEIQKKILYR